MESQINITIDEEKIKEYKTVLKSDRKPHELIPVSQEGVSNLSYLYGYFTWRTTETKTVSDRFEYYIQCPATYALITNYMAEYKWRVICDTGCVVYRGKTEEECTEFIDKLKLKYQLYLNQKEKIKQVVEDYDYKMKKQMDAINILKQHREAFKASMLSVPLSDERAKKFLKFRIERSFQFAALMNVNAGYDVEATFTDETGMLTYSKLANDNCTVERYIDLFRMSRAQYLDLQPITLRKESRENWKEIRKNHRESRLKTVESTSQNSSSLLDLMVEDYQGQETQNDLEIPKYQFEYTDDSSSDEEIEYK